MTFERDGIFKTEQCHNICNFFGDFGFITQAILAVLSFAILLVKHYREVPRREATVFKFDVTKNALGAIEAHITNIVLAKAFAGNSDPCPWYFINILFDTTVVVGMNFLLLRGAEIGASRFLDKDLSSGQYGNPPLFQRFAEQLGVWMLIVLINKTIMAGFFYLMQSQLSDFGRLMLSPLCFNPHLELFVVMVLTPLILNACQFWMQDNFLKLSSGYISLTTAERMPGLLEGQYSGAYYSSFDKSHHHSQDRSSSNNANSDFTHTGL